MAELFAEVVIIGTALQKGLHYSVPDRLAEAVRPGSRVAVELGKRKAAGIVVRLEDSPSDLPGTVKIRSILDVIDDSPAIPADLLELCLWVSRYYFYPLGEVFDMVVPFGRFEPAGTALRGPRRKIVSMVRDGDFKLKSAKSNQIVEFLRSAGGKAGLSELRKACGNPDYSLKKLVRDGILEIGESGGPGIYSVLEEEPDRSRGDLDEAVSHGPPGHPETMKSSPFFVGAASSREELFVAVKPPVLELSGDQRTAVEEIGACLQEPHFQPFVLYGVTGSGKTEIYLRLIEKMLPAGKGALVLVPEIGISAQMETIFRERFGDRLAVWHSALPERERRRTWAEIRSGMRKVVLGARSAVLTPVTDLGIVIVDEEHDSSYKQEDHLRYNGRDVALVRGKIAGVPVVMGSATPSIATMYRCLENKYRTISLPSRILNRPRPGFEVVDMKREGGRAGIFSFKLKEAIGETLNAGRQTLLFLNRRGYDKYYLCNACGQALHCISCSVTLTYHKKDNRLRCHYCGWETDLPERCPVCSHAALFPHGFGTERVEKEVGKLFPEAGIVRMDRDSMNSHQNLLSALDSVRSGKADILLGTQMVAKGHDFPNLTLVGIINADAGLQAPDFRAGEALVQLLIQVAGRAGRGEEPGRVILQTYNPCHFTIDSALRLDYDGFCREELKSRKELQYPPFARLLKVLITSPSEESARSCARLFSEICREKADLFREAGKSIAVLGPAPSSYLKLKNRFRWQVFIKTWTSGDMQSFVECTLDSAGKNPALRSVQITVDRDPTSEL